MEEQKKNLNSPEFVKAHYENGDAITVGQSNNRYTLLVESNAEENSIEGENKECMVLSEISYRRLLVLMLTHAKHYGIDLRKLINQHADSNGKVIYTVPS